MTASPMAFWHALALGLDIVAAIGLLQAALGAGAVRRFRRRSPALAGAPLPPVSILKPLRGDEPLIEDALASFCRLDYPRYEIVFGVQDPEDPVIPKVERLRERFPDVAMRLVIDPRGDEPNRKIANLMNMLPAARHDVLVIADSDIHVERQYLRQLVATLARPGTGLATTLYTGRPANPGPIGRLGAMHINQIFLPGVLLARALGRRDCLGASMAIRRATLERAGGLAALAAHLADDAVLGRLVRAQGLEVGLAGTVPSTTVPERRLADLLRHELRWARTNRALEPLGFALSALQFPIAWALLAGLAAGGAPWAIAALLACWAARSLVSSRIDADLQPPSRTQGWLLPLREVLSIGLVAASFTGNTVVWRDQVLRVPPRPRQAAVGTGKELTTT